MPGKAPPHSPPAPPVPHCLAPAPARVHHQRSPGLHVCVVEAPPLTELHLTVTPLPQEPVDDAVARLGAVMHRWHASVVRLLAFGAVDAAPATLAQLQLALGESSLPLTWVEGAATDAHPLAGLQVHALAGTEVAALDCGTTRARVWSDADARHCVFSPVHPSRVTARPEEQAHETFTQLQHALGQTGFAMHHVARTWFFLDEILAWYPAFNRVRNDCFARTELRPGSVPASTGVSGRNPAGAAVALAVWAAQPRDPARPVIHIVPSPRQCPAPAYGSAFSRAVEIRSAGCRRLLISGTASIEPGGATAHVGDVQAQIRLTMEVVQAILASREMTRADVSRATAYFRHAADAPHFAAWLKQHAWSGLPVVHATCDICRDDLLFELELDAIQPLGTHLTV